MTVFAAGNGDMFTPTTLVIGAVILFIAGIAFLIFANYFRL